MLNFTIGLALEAGKYLRDNVNRRFEVSRKNVHDIVTEIDHESERLIKTRIQTQYPNHEIFAEESEAIRTGSPFRWIIDPLDGTANYAHGYPCFAVSIALEQEGEVMCGAVYDPMRDELFVAEMGRGAWLNHRPIHVSQTATLDNSFLGTGFPTERSKRKTTLEHFSRIKMVAHSIRRDGSSALDLCYVASGRYDGFWEFGLQPWDTAAGTLIVKEAGGKVSRFDGSEFDNYGSETLATNGIIHAELQEYLTVYHEALNSHA